MTWKEIGAALAAPFPAKDVEWRVSHEVRNGESALVLAYLTARAVQQRFDDVLGPGCWNVEYQPGPGGGVKARIGCCGSELEDWVYKEDGAENTDVEAIKGGYSSAFKRAAVVWGIGRYLYDLGDTYVVLGKSGSESHKRKDGTWVNLGKSGSESHKRKDGTWVKWTPPALPAWAVPNGKSPRKAESATERTEATRDESHDKLLAAFAEQGVTEPMIVTWLGHDLATVGDFELDALKDIYRRVKSGKSTWAIETTARKDSHA